MSAMSELAITLDEIAAAQSDQKQTRWIAHHLASNAHNIVREAVQYAKTYSVDIERALHEVAGEYVQGYFESVEAARYE